MIAHTDLQPWTREALDQLTQLYCVKKWTQEQCARRMGRTRGSIRFGVAMLLDEGGRSARMPKRLRQLRVTTISRSSIVTVRTGA